MYRSDFAPADLLLPSALLANALVIWLRGQRLTGKFFSVSLSLSALCIPIGFVILLFFSPGEESCESRELCFSWAGPHWMINGSLGLLTCVVLAAANLLVAGMRRRSSRRRSDAGNDPARNTD